MSINPLPLYYNSECTEPVPYEHVDGKIVYEPLDFGRLDEEQQKTSKFYARNASMGVVEELKVAVNSVNKEKISVELVSPSLIDRFAVLQVYTGVLEWKAQKGVIAGTCRVHVAISGMLTKE